MNNSAPDLAINSAPGPEKQREESGTVQSAQGSDPDGRLPRVDRDGPTVKIPAPPPAGWPDAMAAGSLNPLHALPAYDGMDTLAVISPTARIAVARHLPGAVMKPPSFVELLEKGAPASKLTEVICHELSVFNLGKTVDFNFLSRPSVGGYCRSLGFAKNRNWSMLALDKLAPKSPQGPRVVPEREAKAVLAQLRYAIDAGLLEPKIGKPQPDIISDFLPKGKRYKRARTLGHLWEFQYALAVEMEHGKSRGSNLTNNHPLLTALVVVAHLTEDKLYYARLWEMETSGSLFNAQLDNTPAGPIMKENMRAKVYLQQRLQERVENA